MMMRKFAGIPVQINFIEENMRRVQGRPQSPWNKEPNLFVLYDKLVPLQNTFRENQGGLCGRPLDPFAVPIFEGALFRIFLVS